MGRLPPCGQASGTTIVALVDNSGQRLYAHNRRSQTDIRFAKIFRFGGRRVDVGVAHYNLLNTNYATAYENQYDYVAAKGRTWNNPTTILGPRFVRSNLTFDF